MSRLQTPPPTQLAQETSAGLIDTMTLTHHEKYYNADAPDPIFIRVSYLRLHLPELSY